MQARKRRGPSYLVPRATVNILIEGRPVWGELARRSRRLQLKEMLSLSTATSKGEPTVRKALPKPSRRPSTQRQAPRPQEEARKPSGGMSSGESASTGSGSGYIHIVLYRDRSGHVTRSEIQEVSREEALKHCKAVSQGKGCTIVGGPYYKKPCKQEEGVKTAPGCMEYTPSRVIYWGPDTRDRPCKTKLAFVGGTRVECMDKALADAYKHQLETLVKQYAFQLKGPSTADRYRFILGRIADYFIELLDKERLKYPSDSDKAVEVVKTIGKNALEALAKAKELLKTMYPQVRNEHEYEKYKSMGLVSETCPTFGIGGKRTNNKEHPILWCKRWLCMKPKGLGLDVFIAESRDWCSYNLEDVKNLKAPY